jgi:glycerophosphoryl diester phosphodiesterase
MKIITAVGLLSLMFMSCAIFQRSPDAAHQAVGKKYFDKQGHRGCRGLMPENTIPAMVKALDLGCTTLEMDVVITKDGQVVLSHEPFFNHEISTKPDGTAVTESEEKSLNIFHMTYDEVITYDVGLKPHPRFPQQQKIKATKPLLKAVIDSCDSHATAEKRALPFYNIETKTTKAGDGIYHPNPAEFVNTLMAVIKEKKIEDRVIVQSFDIRTLQYLHQNFPHIKTALLVEAPFDKSLAIRLKELGFIPSIYSPNYSIVTPLLVKQCRDLGMKVIPWTVNDKATIQRLTNMGVDGIITDDPNLF